MAQSLLLSALGDEALTVQQIQAVLRKTLEEMLAAQQRAAQEEAVRLVACAANSGAAAVVALTEKKAAKAEDAIRVVPNAVKPIVFSLFIISLNTY